MAGVDGQTESAPPATSPASTFERFTRLPPELRTQIWKEALPYIPDDDTPVLYPYKKGCWQPRYLAEDDPDYLPDSYIVLDFCHDQLDLPRADLSHLFVNHEAQAVAVAWIRETKLQVRYNPESGCHTVTRPFQPYRDVMYIIPDRLSDFDTEPYERLFQPDLNDRNVSSGPPLAAMAAPETLFRNEFPSVLQHISEWYVNVDKFWLITNPDCDKLDDAMGRGEFRELVPVRGVGFHWDGERLDALSENGERIRETFLPEKAWRLTEELWEAFTTHDVNHFEIKLAYAA